jgi:hypothetical protein
MLVQHLLLGQAAGPHGLVEMLKVDPIHVPDDDGQDCQQGLAAMGSLGRRDKLARQNL